ncbi:MAG: hypothetical protein WCX73_05515, partial [Candidatus Pacearchaeota archaeon]
KSILEINLDKYMKIMQLDSDMEDIQMRIEVISILTGLKEEDIKNINIRDLKFIEKNLSFIYTEGDIKLQDKIKIQGKTYYLQSHLDDMKMYEFIDLEWFSKPDNYKFNIHNLMAILYREKKKSGNIFKNIFSYIYNRKEYVKSDENFETRSEIFKNYMTSDIVKSTLIFFSILKTALINLSLGYSPAKVKMEMNQLIIRLKGDSIPDGGGVEQFTKSLGKTSLT